VATDVARSLVEFAIRDYIAADVFPKPLISELVEEKHWNSQGVTKRRAEFFARLLIAPSFQTLVEQLLDDPCGTNIAVPKTEAVRPDVAELVFSPLTVD
jgi:hypothetical protein